MASQWLACMSPTVPSVLWHPLVQAPNSCIHAMPGGTDYAAEKPSQLTELPWLVFLQFTVFSMRTVIGTPAAHSSISSANARQYAWMHVAPVISADDATDTRHHACQTTSRAPPPTRCSGSRTHATGWHRRRAGQHYSSDILIRAWIARTSRGDRRFVCLLGGTALKATWCRRATTARCLKLGWASGEGTLTASTPVLSGAHICR
jgi:hypothetical protein